MSTLTSASTITAIEAAYLDNASYEEDASVAKAKAFVTACRFLLLKRPTESEFAGTSRMRWTPELWQQEMKAAQAWLPTQAGASGATDNVSHPDFTYFRS